jgi:hypothetical protein
VDKCIVCLDEVLELNSLSCIRFYLRFTWFIIHGM